MEWKNILFYLLYPLKIFKFCVEFIVLPEGPTFENEKYLKYMSMTTLSGMLNTEIFI